MKIKGSSVAAIGIGAFLTGVAAGVAACRKDALRAAGQFFGGVASGAGAVAVAVATAESASRIRRQQEMEARIPAALILRGVTSSTVQVRHPNGRDRRLLRKFAERQQAQRRELTQG